MLCRNLNVQELRMLLRPEHVKILWMLLLYLLLVQHHKLYHIYSQRIDIKYFGASAMAKRMKLRDASLAGAQKEVVASYTECAP